MSIDASPTSQPPARTQFIWSSLALGYLSLFTYGFVDNSRGPVFPDLLREFSLNDSAGALFFLIASAAALLNNALVFGWMERAGPRRTTQVFSLVQIVGLAVIGLGSVYWLTLVGATIVGASLGGLGIAQNLLVAEGSPERYRRQILSGLHCTYGLSSLLAPLCVSWFYNAGFTWREAMAWLALGPAAAFLLTIVVRREPESLSGARPAVPVLAREPLLRPRKIAIFYAILASLYVVAELSLSSRLALLARREWGYTPSSANEVLSLFFASMFIGRLFFALIPLRFKSRSILFVSACLALCAYALGLRLGPVWLAAAGGAMSVFYPCLIALINDEQGKWSGYITSWSITLQSLGLIAMNFILGGLSDAWGLGRSLWLGPIAMALVLVMLVLLPKFAPAVQCAKAS